jgi:hypothetical protein
MSVKEIVIQFDIENKTINSIEGTEDVSPVDIAKILMSVALTSLNKIKVKKEGKIIKPKLKIVGGNHGGTNK